MQNYWLFVRRNWALLLFGFTCVFWGNLGQSFFLGWYGDAVKTSLGLSAQQYGTTYSLATLCSAMVIMWVGGWIDVWPLKRFVVVTGVGLMLACVLFSFAANVWILALAFLGMRLFGQGLFPHSGLTTMARQFDRDRGKAISLAATGVSIGEVLLPLLAVYLILHVGWQQSWLLLAASVPLCLLPLLVILLRKAGWRDDHLNGHLNDTADPGVTTTQGRGVLFKDWRFWLAAPTILSIPFMLTAIFIHQDFILQEKNWSSAWMASCFILYGTVHWFSSMVYGVLVDRFSALKLYRFYTLPLIAALLVVANVPGDWGAPLMMTLLGLAVGASGPVLGSLWAEIYGTAKLGGIRSAAGSFIVLSTAISPIVFGWLIDADVSLALMLNMSAGLFFMSLLLLRFSYRPVP